MYSRVSSSAPSFPLLTLPSVCSSQFTIWTTRYTTMKCPSPPWHYCQGTGKNHQSIFVSSWRGAMLKVVPVSTPAFQKAWGRVTASSVPFIFSSKTKKLLVCALFDGRDQFLSPNSSTAARLAALVFNKLLFYRQLQKIAEQKGYQANNKNADGENILINNIRLALNSVLVSPQPIKSPLPCAPF